MVNDKIWVNGSIISKSDFRFSPLDHGLTTGDGVFETLAAYQGKVFEGELHMKRMLNSARGLGINVEDQVESILQGMNELIEANQNQNTERLKIRLTVTGGDALLGSDKGDNARPFVFIAMMPFHLYPQETKIVSVPWPRNERGALCGFKTISYGENVRALAYAKERGGTEALFLNSIGNVCEGTGSNIFWVQDKKLYTTPLSSGCLGGITRHVVIEEAQSNGIPFAEKDASPEELKNADEAFLSSSLREVQSIREIDDQVMKNACGELSQELSRLFLKRAFS